jgi:hypothetical protein
MHTFKDKADRSWDLEATYASYARVKAHTGVSLFDLATEERKSLEQLADPFVLGQVIWCMVEPQAIARKLTPEAFYEAFDGKTLEAAYNALIDEMVFFCPTRVQKILTVAVKKVRDVDAVADKVVEDRMPQIEAAIDEELARWTCGPSGMSSPASSASTPDPGPSASSSQPSRDASVNYGTTPVASSLN